MNEEMIKFFKNPANGTEKATILKHRFIYDVSLAATKRGYYLSNFISDVDNEGADIILSDGETTRPIQLKAVFKDGKTDSWDIYKQLIRPVLSEVEALGFQPGSDSLGTGGAFVLQVIHKVKDEIKIVYQFADIYTLLANYWGIINYKAGSCSKKTLSDFMTELTTGKRNSKIKIRRSMLLTAKSPEHLLSFLTLHSRIDGRIDHNLIEWKRIISSADSESKQAAKTIEKIIRKNLKNFAIEKLV